MYGLVNQAIQEMVVSNFGDDKWDEIRDKAGADDIFIAMDPLLGARNYINK